MHEQAPALLSQYQRIHLFWKYISHLTKEYLFHWGC